MRTPDSSYEKAQKLVDEGMSMVEAAKQNGLKPDLFYAWRSKHGLVKRHKDNKQVTKQATKPSLQEIHVTIPTTERVFCVIGTPSDIADVINRTKQ